MNEIPESCNLYGWLSAHSSWDVAPLLQPHGWKTRKCAFDEHEATKDNAEILLQSNNPVLISGAFGNLRETVAELAQIFRTANLEFSFELYGAAGEITETITHETRLPLQDGT